MPTPKGKPQARYVGKTYGAFAKPGPVTIEPTAIRGRSIVAEDLRMHRRSADLEPRSFDESKMTVDAILVSARGKAVRRKGFVEDLDLNGLDTRGIVGTPVIEDHHATVRNTVGVIQSVRFENGNLAATIRLSLADDAASTVTKIREGVLRGVSIGYRVSKWSETNSAGQTVRTARQWQIIEVSAVPLPADIGATFR